MKKLLSALLCVTLLQSQTWAKEKVNLCLSLDAIKDFKTNGILSMNIEAMEHEYSSMKGTLSGALDNLKQCSDFGEVMLQKIINLLDVEITIVNYLLCGQHGSILQNAMVTRNQMITQSAPSVAYIYDKVVDLAAYDQETNSKLYKSGRCGCSLAYALCWRDKQCFLTSMRNKLLHYHAMMRQMQCDMAIGTATVEHTMPMDSRGNSISFCPIIR